MATPCFLASGATVIAYEINSIKTNFWQREDYCDMAMPVSFNVIIFVSFFFAQNYWKWGRKISEIGKIAYDSLGNHQWRIAQSRSIQAILRYISHRKMYWTIDLKNNWMIFYDFTVSVKMSRLMLLNKSVSNMEKGRTVVIIFWIWEQNPGFLYFF